MNNQSAEGKTINFFCGEMLDGGVEKAHKAVRVNELATPERATEKKFSGW